MGKRNDNTDFDFGRKNFAAYINRKSLIPTSLEIFEHLKWS